MHNITLISTIHKKNGKCNADELFNILKKENPQVVFIEALKTTYSSYDRLLYSSFGTYHQKLEIEAIQKYSNHTSFEYVPVLDDGLPESFDEKYEFLRKNSKLQVMIDEFNLLAKNEGFQFLNSKMSITLHQKMRSFENYLLNDNKLKKRVEVDIDTYENSMIRNIYTYCMENPFDKAVFMCGSAHRKSLIEKIMDFNDKEEENIYWSIYGNQVS